MTRNSFTATPRGVVAAPPTPRRRLPWQAAMLMWAMVFYAAWLWGDYLNETAFSRDRYFYTLHFLYGSDRPHEPLWVVIAPLIGEIFGDRAFEAASLMTLAMIGIGLRLHRVPAVLSIVLIFSPGVAYFLTNALRQGFAIGVFLILISFFQRRDGPEGLPAFRWWWVVLATVAPALIHNSMVVVSFYVLASLSLLKVTAYGRRSQCLQLALLGTSACATPFALQFGGTAGVLIGGQAALLLGSLVFRKLRGPLVPLLSLYLTVCAAGFMLTSTGLRIEIMVSLLALLMVPRFGRWIAIAGCVLYPLVQYGGFAIEDENSWQG